MYLLDESRQSLDIFYLLTESRPSAVCLLQRKKVAYVMWLAEASKIDVIVGKFEELGCFSFLNHIIL